MVSLVILVGLVRRIRVAWFGWAWAGHGLASCGIRFDGWFTLNFKNN